MVEIYKNILKKNSIYIRNPNSIRIQKFSSNR